MFNKAYNLAMKPKISFTGLAVVLLSLALSACTSLLPNAKPTPHEQQTHSAPSPAQIFPNDMSAVWAAALAVLAEKRIPIAVTDWERGQIVSASVELDPAELARLSTAREELTRHGGRYVLRLQLERVATQQTRVTATLLLVAHLPWSFNPLGGVPVPSRGVLESEILDALAEKL